MSKPLRIGKRVKISNDAKDAVSAASPESFIRSKHTGQEGMYVGELLIGDVSFAAVEFDDGKQVIFRKQYIEPL